MKWKLISVNFKSKCGANAARTVTLFTMCSNCDNKGKHAVLSGHPGVATCWRQVLNSIKLTFISYPATKLYISSKCALCAADCLTSISIILPMCIVHTQLCVALWGWLLTVMAFYSTNMCVNGNDTHMRLYFHVVKKCNIKFKLRNLHSDSLVADS